jgi:hypothetical protein
MPTPVLIFVVVVVVIVSAVWIWSGRFNRRHRLDTEFNEVFGFQSPERDELRLHRKQPLVWVAIHQAGMELGEARANLKHYGSKPAKNTSELGPGIAILIGTSKVVEQKEGEYKRLRRLARNAGYSRAFLSDIDLKVRHGLRNKEEAARAQPVRSAS